jgi:hypothetical protein
MKFHGIIERLRTPGGLFDVEPCEMDLNVGKRGRYLNPTCVIEQEEFVIAGVQKNHQDVVVYRVIPVSDIDKFGRCAHPSQIEIFEG